MSEENINNALKSSGNCHTENIRAVILGEIRKSLGKDYFTLPEREDIMMLSLLLCDLYDECAEWSAVCLNASSFAFSNEIPTLSGFITDGIENIKNMLTAFSKLSKGFSADAFASEWADIIKRFRRTISEIAHRVPADIANCARECMNRCGKIVNYVEYAAIKNT